MQSDSLRGDSLDYSILGTIFLTVIAAVHVPLDTSRLLINGILMAVMIVGLFLIYVKSKKQGIAWMLIGGLLTAIGFAFFDRASLSALWFWVIWTPLASLAIIGLQSSVRGLRTQKDFYFDKMERLSLVDEQTQLKNLFAYRNDAPVYMKLAKRYDLELVLICWQLRNAETLKASMSDESFTDLMQQISGVLRATLRTEDIAYMINIKTYTWGLMMFTHSKDINIVIDRLLMNLNKIKIDCEDPEIAKLDIAHGYAVFDNSGEVQPQQLLENASSNLT